MSMQILMRRPTAAEVISFEDKRRAARRPRKDDEEALGALYDGGSKELAACAISHTPEQVEAILDESPGVIDRLADEFRRLGGAGERVTTDPDGVPADIKASMGKRALAYRYGARLVILRKMSRGEYESFRAEEHDANFFAQADKIARACILSPDAGELPTALDQHPYLTLTLGQELLRLAMGRAEVRVGKSAAS